MKMNNCIVNIDARCADQSICRIIFNSFDVQRKFILKYARRKMCTVSKKIISSQEGEDI